MQVCRMYVGGEVGRWTCVYVAGLDGRYVDTRLADRSIGRWGDVATVRWVDGPMGPGPNRNGPIVLVGPNNSIKYSWII